MGRKRPIESLPPACSSEEEDTEAEEEEEAVEVSSDEDYAVHDGGSDAEPNSGQSFPSLNISDFTVKPIERNPIPEPPKKSETSGKPTGEEKAAPTRRLWSEEDELAFLRAMIEYKAAKGIDPFADIGGFYDLVKKSVRDDVTQAQVKDKIRKMKKKYEANELKGASGEAFSFPKPRDKKVFELAKKIWGVETKESKKPKKKAKINDQENGQVNGGITLGLAASKDKERKAVSREGSGAGRVEETGDVMADDKHEENAEVGSNYPFLKKSLETEQLLEMPCFLKGLLRDNLEHIPKGKAKELERKWRELQQDELILYQKRIELVKEQSQVAFDFIKGSDDN